jgi:hypothetical protein
MKDNKAAAEKRYPSTTYDGLIHRDDPMSTIKQTSFIAGADHSDAKHRELIDAVSSMRIFQKAFHSSERGTHSWQQNLQDSKAAESRVDRMIKEFNNNQVKLDI